MQSLQQIIECLNSIQTLLAAIMAALIAWRFNASKIRLDTESFKRDLFLRYNEQYNQLNEKLEDLGLWEYEIQRDHKLEGGESLESFYDQIFNDEPMKTPEKIQPIFDYINLCSEEYYWYKKGLIDRDVWRCWKNGMQSWYRDSFFIKKIVAREIEKNAAYYNDDFLQLFRES